MGGTLLYTTFQDSGADMREPSDVFHDDDVNVLFVEWHSVEEGQDTFFAQCLEYCRKRPNVDFLYLSRSLQLSQGCHKLFVTAAALQKVLRHQPLPFRVDLYNTLDIKQRANRAKQNSIGDYMAENWVAPMNFKVYPFDQFDVEIWRSSYLSRKKSYNDWVGQIKKWYKDGI
jgi:hypothetical protein